MGTEINSPQLRVCIRNRQVTVEGIIDHVSNLKKSINTKIIMNNTHSS